MNRIVIDSGIRESRVAIIENDELVDIYVDRIDDQRITGNIYLGRVVNILPGMQAAFVDIGLKKNAFLHLRDALPRNIVEAEDFDIMNYKIEKELKKGQAVLVQVKKEAFNTKGPKVSVHLSITGKYAAVMNDTDYTGVSRKITRNQDRERLREIAKKYLADDLGVIMRTISNEVSEETVAEEIKYLSAKMENIKRKGRISRPPVLISDLDLVQKVIRDYINDDIDEIVVNDENIYNSLQELFELISEDSIEKLKLFEKSHDIFGFMGIEEMIENAVKREVKMKSGACIIIDENEALTSIDVNTAKFTGETNLADTVLSVNIEAAKEIAKQLRLRNIGGIVIIDFIDMKNEEDINTVIDVLKSEVKKDINTTNVLGMTKLGLVEMTRKKTIGRLTTRMLRKCPCCDGFGKVTSERVVISDIENEAKRAFKNTEAKCIAVEVNPVVIEYIDKNYREFHSDIKKYYDIEIIFRGNSDIEYGAHRIMRMGSEKFVRNYLREIEENNFR